MTLKQLSPLAAACVLAACSGGSDSGSSTTNNTTDTTTGTDGTTTTTQATALDITVHALITQSGLTGDPSTGRTLPSISDPLAQLGMKLFFSNSLGGAFDAACASCHHPTLGGADDLSLSIGVDAVTPDHLGEGRVNNAGDFPVPRNAPTTFNVALWDRGLFWDSRVQSLNPDPGQNGAAGGISTPDSGFGMADNNAGANLTVAQSRFPVTSADEMKTTTFENGSSNDNVRNHLAARIGGYDGGFNAQNELATNNWLTEFQTAFVSSESAENLITFGNIAQAIGEYERSQVFVNNPWKEYVGGNYAAISNDAKLGAQLFFTPPNQGGAGCVACHSGDFFTDEGHHVVGFPQIGPGKGNGTTGDDDFGRENITSNSNDRYRFRTPSLLNVEMTAPYGHAGSYATLTDVVRHYRNPQGEATNYVDNNRWCQLPQFDDVANCNNLFPNAGTNTQAALTQLQQTRNAGVSRLPRINLNNAEIAQIVAFLETLTDPCLEDRECLADWIPDTNDSGPDNQQLNATDANGNLL